MKIGKYIRTEYGIGKLVSIEPDNENKNLYYFDNVIDIDNISPEKFEYNFLLEEEIKKYKFYDNLIDLIKPGDYVNGSLVLSIYNEPYGEKEKVLRIERTICKGSAFGDENETVYNNQIKSIVTKEQFKSMEYRIGE